MMLLFCVVFIMVLKRISKCAFIDFYEDYKEEDDGVAEVDKDDYTTMFMKIVDSLNLDVNIYYNSYLTQQSYPFCYFSFTEYHPDTILEALESPLNTNINTLTLFSHAVMTTGIHLSTDIEELQEVSNDVGVISLLSEFIIHNFTEEEKELFHVGNNKNIFIIKWIVLHEYGHHLQELRGETYPQSYTIKTPMTYRQQPAEKDADQYALSELTKLLQAGSIFKY